MGITAYEDTFNSKNTYENILTGINKEEINKKSDCPFFKMPHQAESQATPTYQ
jgi:hypothetical protein